MLRKRRNVEIAQAIEITKSLDVFPKLEDDYKDESSSTRGTFSIVVFSIIIFLVLFELKYFLTSEIKYSYEVDTDHRSKLKLNIDITVAMPCNSIGADVMDSTSRDILTDQKIDMEETWFEMSPNQRHAHQSITNIYEEIRNDYHSLHSSLWSSYESLPTTLGPREVIPDRPRDACRIHGTFDLNKIAGNMHIISGKSVSFFGNHAHMVNMFENTPSNFSHRIDNFSFGENSRHVHNALNFDYKVTDSAVTSYLYFVSIVPTEFNGDQKNIYQYSVTEKTRRIDHDGDSHGTPGIFFKYDITPLKVKVDLKPKSIIELIIPLIGIVGGIFATSTMINALSQIFIDLHKKK